MGADTSIFCHRCGANLGPAPAGAFCPACGARLSRAQASTGQVKRLDGAGLRGLVADQLDALRLRVDAPDVLLEEGHALERLVGRWDVLEPGERSAGFSRIAAWVRASGEHATATKGAGS